jgi:hypothetical protein
MKFLVRPSPQLTQNRNTNCVDLDEEFPLAQRIVSRRHISLSFFLFLAAIIASGCGGGSKTSTSTPAPTPVPTPAPAALAATPNNVGFGSLAVNTTASQTVKVTNTGGTAITITQDNVVGMGFSVGVTTPINLDAGQSVNVPVVFTPTAAGTVSGSLTFATNGTTVLTVPLSGTGLAPLAHSVDIVWDASTSPTLFGYNVYRGSMTGGPYAKISSTLTATTLLFTDTSPVSGQKYFYVVTAVDAGGAESAASMEAAVTIPTP